MFSYAYLDPDEVSLEPDGYALIHVKEVDCDAYGCVGPFSPNVRDWEVYDPDFAVLFYGSGSDAQVFGFNGGTAYFQANIAYDQYAWDGLECLYGGVNIANTTGSAHVLKVNSISPARGAVGTTISETITGHDFGSSPSVSAGSGITVTVTSANSTTIHATFEIGAQASQGNRNVTVTVGGRTSSKNYFVQIPTSLSLSTGQLRAHTGGSITDCQANVLVATAYGYSRLLTYTVLDQSGATIAQDGLTATEQVYLVSSCPSGSGGDFTKSTDVASDGTFCDVQALFRSSSPAPQSGDYIKLKQIINITVPGRLDVVRVNCLNEQYNDVTITNTTSSPNATCQ